MNVEGKLHEEAGSEILPPIQPIQQLGDSAELRAECEQESIGVLGAGFVDAPYLDEAFDFCRFRF
jgi:hypothetical protein